MEAREFRIGNYVLQRNQICEIKGIHTQTYGENEDRKQYLYINVLSNHNRNYEAVKDYEIEPIPLTEEWLLKFGFQQLDNTKCYQISYNFLNRIKTLNIEGKIGFSASIEYDNKFAMVSMLNYVHQLQNLYFVLTGEELNSTDEHKYTYSVQGEKFRKLK